MVVDGTTFLKRAQKFMLELKANRFPNAVTLAEQVNCSKNTAQRTIYRLRDEYLVPLDYDPSEKGYFLLDKEFELPSFLPPGKDELTALLLAREYLRSIDAVDLTSALDSLWTQFAGKNSSVISTLEPLAERFSCDATVIADMSDSGILNYVTLSQTGESIRITYKSPWRHTTERVYEGRILRVHFSDNSLYLLFNDSTGREFVLNASFVRQLEVLPYTVVIPPSPGGESKGSEHWLEGFGIWAGKEVEEILVHITAPASQYYSAQRWHIDQEDRWEGTTLVRRFPGIVSPELVRRILSLGRFVSRIEPPALREMVLEDAVNIVGALSE